MLRIELAWAQLQSGVSFPLLEKPAACIPPIDTKWLVSLRQFLASLNSKFRISCTYIYPNQRQFDCHLMDIALEMHFSTQELQYINHCRLYLQVCTLSDICTVDGKRIHFNAFSDTSHALPSTPKWPFPVQDKPSPKVWKVWDLFLNTFIHSDYLLKRPLGKWLFDATTLAHTWHQIYDPDTNVYYQRQSDGDWLIYTQK